MYRELNHILSFHGLLRQPNNQKIIAGSAPTDHQRDTREHTNEIFTWRIGYSLRGKQKPLIIGLAILAFILYIILTCVALPAVALLALRLDVQHERQSRPAQTRVPSLKGLSYEDAETKLHAANLNIRLLATRYDLPLPPGLIIDQVPQPGDEVVFGYPVGVTITKADNNHRP